MVFLVQFTKNDKGEFEMMNTKTLKVEFSYWEMLLNPKTGNIHFVDVDDYFYTLMITT